MDTERKASMEKARRKSLPIYASSDSLKVKDLSDTVSHSIEHIEKKFHKTVSWIGEHLGAKKSKPKNHSQSVAGKGHGTPHHVRNTIELHA